MGVFWLILSILPMGIQSNGDQVISGAGRSAAAPTKFQASGLRVRVVRARANLQRLLTRIGVQSRGVLL